MKTRIFLLATLMSFLSSAFAQEVNEITYTPGLEKDSLTIEKVIQETHYRSEDYDSTCYNTEYDTEYVCRNVTRYRSETRSSTCYRERCSTSSERVCRSVPSSRRVCTDRPSRTHCHDVNGRRRCNTTPGGQNCRNVSSSRQECSSQPRRSCRQESYSCTETVNVPYQDEECGNETTSRQVPYDCVETRQIPYTVEVPYTAEISVNYLKQSEEEHIFAFVMNDKGELSVKQTNETNQLVKLKSFEVDTQETDGTKTLKALAEIKFLSTTQDIFVNTKVTKPVYSAESKIMTFTTEELEAALPAKLVFTLKHKKRSTVYYTKELTVTKEMLVDGVLSINLKELGFNGTIKPRKQAIKLKLSKELADVLNPQVPAIEKDILVRNIKLSN